MWKQKWKYAKKRQFIWEACINMVRLKFPILLNNIHSLYRQVSIDTAKRSWTLVYAKQKKTQGDAFTAKRVEYVSGLIDVSERTVRRCLNKHKYSNCTKRRKGIVTTKDCRKRKTFPNTVTNTLTSDFWTNCVSFILMG